MPQDALRADLSHSTPIHVGLPTPIPSSALGTLQGRARVLATTPRVGGRTRRHHTYMAHQFD